MIEITENQINRVDAILAGVKNAHDIVFSNAVRRGLSAARTEGKKAIRQTYNVKAKALSGFGKMKQKKKDDGIVGRIEIGGAVIPLIQFKVSPKEVNERKTVKAAVFRDGTGETIAQAYVTNLKGGVGVFERLTSKRETSQTFYGPSVAHMAENVNVLPKMEEIAQRTVNERIEHEISRILNGYGGKK